MEAGFEEAQSRAAAEAAGGCVERAFELALGAPSPGAAPPADVSRRAVGAAVPPCPRTCCVLPRLAAAGLGSPIAGVLPADGQLAMLLACIHTGCRAGLSVGLPTLACTVPIAWHSPHPGPSLAGTCSAERQGNCWSMPVGWAWAPQMWSRRSCLLPATGRRCEPLRRPCIPLWPRLSRPARP